MAPEPAEDTLRIHVDGGLYGMEPNAAWAQLNTLLETPLAVALLPIGYGLLRFVEYLIKRKTEGAAETRDMAALHSAADLRDKLSRQNITVEDLKSFREQALGKSAQIASDTPQHYIERAEFLVLEDRTGRGAEWPEASTQADMTLQAAAQFTMAEDELTSLILEKMVGYSAEEGAAFQQAQDSWRAWRAAEAEWESKIWEGGSIRSLMVSTKLEQLTRERIAAIHLAGDLETNPRNTPVNYKHAPRDLPEHIEPGITGARVREILGVPHYISGQFWYYRFKEIQLELDVEGEVVTEVTFAVIAGEVYVADLGGMEPFAFGQLTFGHLLEAFPEMEIKTRSSMATEEIYTSVYVGIPGLWKEYYFGAVIPIRGGANLAPTDFEFDWVNKELKGFPTNTIVNWFGTTHKFDDVPGINWNVR